VSAVSDFMTLMMFALLAPTPALPALLLHPPPAPPAILLHSGLSLPPLQLVLAIQAITMLVHKSVCPARLPA
jgi:hypothetical protein